MTGVREIAELPDLLSRPPPREGRCGLGQRTMLNAIIFNSNAMTHRLVRGFAMCIVLLHVAGGCCWHHDHAPCLCQCEDERATGTNECDESACGEFHQCHDGCDDEECDFVRCRLRSVVKTGGVLPPLAVVTMPVCVAPSTVRAPFDAPHLNSSPPLRLHLLHQILLI